MGNPRLLARVSGFFYLLVFVTGSYALAAKSAAWEVVSGSCYIVVTLLFYRLFKPVSAGVSLLAMLVGLTGCTLSILNRVGVAPLPINPLAIFGCYCLLTGYLILRSSFLPSFLGVLMAIGGASWLTFASAALARRLSPYNFAPGVLAEGVLTLWLLIVGVKEERWRPQAGSA